MAEKQKKCGHKGRISRRRETGLMHCSRLKCEVTVIVGATHNHCACEICPVPRNEIPRAEI